MLTLCLRFPSPSFLTSNAISSSLPLIKSALGITSGKLGVSGERFLEPQSGCCSSTSAVKKYTLYLRLSQVIFWKLCPCDEPPLPSWEFHGIVDGSSHCVPIRDVPFLFWREIEGIGVENSHDHQLIVYHCFPRIHHSNICDIFHAVPPLFWGCYSCHTGDYLNHSERGSHLYFPPCHPWSSFSAS